jgi:hypothetical protein
MKKEKKPRPLRSMILSGLGKVWIYWPARLAAKKRAKHPTKAGWYICEMCKGERERIEVDHKIPCIKPADGFTSWDAYIASRFVESADALQSLCRECHAKKTKEEGVARKARRAANKRVTAKDLDEWSKRAPKDVFKFPEDLK